jgi:hypothetical protein
MPHFKRALINDAINADLPVDLVEEFLESRQLEQDESGDANFLRAEQWNLTGLDGRCL